MSDNPQEWTVLIYASGNNDLSTKILRRFQQICELRLTRQTNVIIQISQAPGKLLASYANKQDKIIPEGLWSGTRRYSVTVSGTLLLNDLGVTDMANPIGFTGFLVWGYEQCPAERLMVIISGHSAGFLGLLVNCSQDSCTAMSAKALARSLSFFQQHTGKKIDVLVLDTCFTNMIEFWYEIAMAEGNPVQSLIVPLEEAPSDGLPCHFILKQLAKSSQGNSTMQEILKDIVSAMNTKFALYPILAVNLEYGSVRLLSLELAYLAEMTIKQNLLHTIAAWRQNQYTGSIVSFLDMEKFLNGLFLKNSVPLFYQSQALDSIIVSPNLSLLRREQHKGPKIYFPSNSMEYLELRNFYDGLLFSRDTSWNRILERLL